MITTLNLVLPQSNQVYCGTGGMLPSVSLQNTSSVAGTCQIQSSDDRMTSQKLPEVKKFKPNKNTYQCWSDITLLIT